MLKVRVLSIGKDKERWLTDGCAHFVKLLSRYCAVELENLPSPRDSTSLPPEQITALEADRFRKRLGRGFVVALSDRGKATDSSAFARLLQRLQTESGGVVTFLIGGPYGLHPGLLKTADLVLSLSPLTFSHQLVRLVLLEQLYRGFATLHGTPYPK